jgi:hypothetical protein
MKVQRLLNTSEVPPDGFRYWQSETRTWVRAPDYDNLFSLVREHRKVNNIPMGAFWQAEIEDQLCQSLPAGFCKEEHPAANRRNILARVGWSEVLHGTQTIVSWAVHGLKHVDQALADSRADVCSRCYYNVQIAGLCGGCQHLQNLAAKFTGGRRTSSEPFLKACAVCKCSLSVKVWLPIEDIRAGTPASQVGQFPDFCWIKRELTMSQEETVKQ